MSWLRRIRCSFERQRLEENLDDELQFHIEMHTQEFIAGEMTSEEARYHAH